MLRKWFQNCLNRVKLNIYINLLDLLLVDLQSKKMKRIGQKLFDYKSYFFVVKIVHVKRKKDTMMGHGSYVCLKINHSNFLFIYIQITFYSYFVIYNIFVFFLQCIYSFYMKLSILYTFPLRIIFYSPKSKIE